MNKKMFPELPANLNIRRLHRKPINLKFHVYGYNRPSASFAFHEDNIEAKYNIAIAWMLRNGYEVEGNFEALPSFRTILKRLQLKKVKRVDNRGKDNFSLVLKD